MEGVVKVKMGRMREDGSFVGVMRFGCKSITAEQRAELRQKHFDDPALVALGKQIESLTTALDSQDEGYVRGIEYALAVAKSEEERRLEQLVDGGE